MANIQLAKNLLQLRQEHHYTQKQLGDKLNITHQAYSYYETGHRDPNIDMLTKLSALYGFSIEQLLTVPCSIKNSFAKESANTYHTGLIITTGDTIYLTEEVPNFSSVCGKRLMMIGNSLRKSLIKCMLVFKKRTEISDD